MSHLAIRDEETVGVIFEGRCLAVYCSGRSSKSIELDVGGVVGDSHYGKDIERAVMITSTKAYQMAEEKGIKLLDGELEENILVDIDPYSLPLQTQIELGDATIELAQYGTICRSLSRIDSRLPKLLKEERGIFARVVKPGMVQSGDVLRVVGIHLAKQGD